MRLQPPCRRTAGLAAPPPRRISLFIWHPCLNGTNPGPPSAGSWKDFACRRSFMIPNSWLAINRDQLDNKNERHQDRRDGKS